jgi:capsule polysaccharide export protein KpsE/RkpR
MKAQKERFEQHFIAIVDNDMQQVSTDNAQSRLDEAFKLCFQLYQDKKRVELGKHLSKVERHFTHSKIYKELDDFYLAGGAQEQNFDVFIEYATDPVKVFLDKANELKNVHIMAYIRQQCEEVQTYFLGEVEVLMGILNRIIKRIDLAMESDTAWQV